MTHTRRIGDFFLLLLRIVTVCVCACVPNTKTILNVCVLCVRIYYVRAHTKESARDFCCRIRRWRMASENEERTQKNKNGLRLTSSRVHQGGGGVACEGVDTRVVAAALATRRSRKINQENATQTA